MLDSYSCFAHKARCCGILTEKLCETRDCPFYKTYEQHLEDRKKYPIIDYKHFLKTGEKVSLEIKGERKDIL